MLINTRATHGAGVFPPPLNFGERRKFPFLSRQTLFLGVLRVWSHKSRLSGLNRSIRNPTVVLLAESDTK